MNTPDYVFELSLIPPSTRYLLGVDEVGRGPWAGPLTVGAFLIDLHNFPISDFQKLKVRDSKKLTHLDRLKIHAFFQKSNFKFSTFAATNAEIDQQGIASCLKNLFSQALAYYAGQYDFALIDGNKVDLEGDLHHFVVKGDSRCFSIAAASIVAKVERDLLMEKYDLEYPDYGFAAHKGYGTSFHLAVLKTKGVCPIHRLSYKPIKLLNCSRN